jgi:alkylation response protein AidB-like acyl-CoA dehydrogenase
MNVERTHEVEDLLAYARQTTRRGKQLSQVPEIRKRLVKAYRDLQVGRALGMRVLDQAAHGRLANAEASELSLHEREARGRMSETQALLYGGFGQLMQDTPFAVSEGVKSWWQLARRHAAGTMEIQRNVIAQRGLGMPR